MTAYNRMEIEGVEERVNENQNENDDDRSEHSDEGDIDFEAEDERHYIGAVLSSYQNTPLPRIYDLFFTRLATVREYMHGEEFELLHEIAISMFADIQNGVMNEEMVRGYRIMLDPIDMGGPLVAEELLLDNIF